MLVRSFPAIFVLLLLSFPLSGCASRSKSGFAAQMSQYLAERNNVAEIGSALERYYKEKQHKQASLSDKERIEAAIKNPVKVDLTGSPVNGSDSAKITVVEFSDFQCPFCKRGRDVVRELKERYKDDIRVVFKNLPLPFHQQALPAAKAALSAGKQGKFWEMYDLLFDNQQRLSHPGLYEELARTLKLDPVKFRSDMEDSSVAAQIERDQAVADQLGIQGTPGFIVNGVEVKGARPASYFTQIIESTLAGASAK